MLKDYFNAEIVSKMTFKEFEATYRGSQVLTRLRIDIKEAFKQLGGKLYKAKKFKKSDD
jgi:hypothetical protein